MRDQIKSTNWIALARLRGLSNYVYDVEGICIENYFEKYKKSNEKCQLNKKGALVK